LGSNRCRAKEILVGLSKLRSTPYFLHASWGGFNTGGRVRASTHLCTTIYNQTNNNSQIMKNLLTTVMLVCTMAVSSLATAANFTVKASKNSVFKVQYVSEQKGLVTVSILDNKNVIVFQEEIYNSGSFIRPYNFSNLTEGTYTIVMKDENGEQRQTINYAAAKSTSYAHVSEIKNQKNKYWLNIVTTGEEKMTVRIYSLTGELLYNQAVTVEGSYSKIFNVIQLNQPTVVFEVTNNNGVVYTSLFD
jgi:hypothetical protein